MNTTARPLVERLGALGDETRTRILALVEENELTVGELAAVLQLPQPNVSRHLKTLSSDRWLQVRAEGRNRHYRVDAELDPSAREVWSIVRGEIVGHGVYAADAERAREVLSARRRRSDAFFADAAERWDDVRGELFGPLAGFAPLLALLEPEWTVADLGCGTGALTDSVAPFVSRVIGVDRSADMLAAADARLAEHSNVELRSGELEGLPIAEATVDLAVLGLVLHYVASPPSALTEARRILRPGGRLVIVDMRSHDRGPAYAEEMGHAWPGFEAERIEAWLTEAGFDSVRTQELRPDPRARGPLLFLAVAS